MDTLFNPNGQTDVHTLVAVCRFFRAHPEGLVRVGVWPDTVWDAARFRRWFRECLADKISSREPRRGRKDSWQYQEDLRFDARVINDYYGRRIIWPGRNILRTLEMQRRYPHIHNPSRDD